MCHRAFALLAVLVPAMAAAQTTGTVQGRITDAANGQALANAQVRIEGTVLGALSDANGQYTVGNVPTGRRVAIARRLGYAEQRRTVDVSSGTPVTADFAMTASATTLGEVVVTGVASPTTKAELPNSIESVSGKDVREAPAATAIDQALQGKITGAVITENSGQPGGGISVRLRGTNSILGGAEPLYVIDGVIVDNDAEALVSLGANAPRGGAALSNRLADLDPADVERIEVLKGAAAAALYGSRANNGVIQIFTRRGQPGEARITASTEYTTGKTPEKYALVSVPLTGAGDSVLLSTPGAPVRTGVPVERFDIQDQVFRTAQSATHRLSLSGGSTNTNTTYYVAGSWQEEEGIIRSSDYERLNLRATVGQQLREELQLTFHGNIIRSKAEFITEGEQTNGVLTSIIFTPTSFNPNFNPTTGRYPYNPLLGPNPLEILEKYEAPEEVSRFIGSTEATWTPLPSLTVRYVAGVDDYRREVRFLQPPFVNSPTFTGSIQNPVQFSRQFNNDLIANHVWSASDVLRLNTGAGFRFTSNRQEILRAAASGLAPEQILVDGAVQSASQSESEVRTLGGFIEERVSWNDRLFLTGGVNLEASSAFGEDARWQTFPRVGVSWLLGEEPFFRESAANVFSSLRVRAAYGQTGGQPPGAYFRFNNFETTAIAGQPGLIESTTRGNPDLRPEQQREWEFGGDIGLVGDRVLLEATYYDKLTSDLVLSVPLAASSGAVRQFQNIGVLSNKGIELSLNTINVARPNFTWRTRLTYAANRNRVERLSTNADTIVIGYLNAVVEGQPIGVFYGGVYERNPDGSILHRDTTIGTRTFRNLPRRLREPAVPGSPVAPPFANRLIGDPNPDFTMSFTNTFELPRGIELNVLLDGRFGNDVANFTRRITEFFGSDKIVEREIAGDTAIGTFARNPIGRINIYEEYIEDGSFVKLREVALTIPIGASLAGRIGARGASVRLAGRNLHTWTDYTGLDPEVNLFSESTVARGVDFATTPLPRQFTAGVSLTF